MLREPFGAYMDAVCSPDTRRIEPQNPTLLVCQKTAGREIVAPTCPGGGSPYTIQTDKREQAAICVPSEVAKYPADLNNPTAFPCKPGDYVATNSRVDGAPGGPRAEFICLPATGAQSAASASGQTMGDLNTRYASLRKQYEALVQGALADPSTLTTALPKIESINQQIAAVLDQMLKELQFARDGGNSEAYRAELIQLLTRIQSDYNGLKANTDKLETLRRIRNFQDTSWRPTLLVYVGLLILFGIVLVLVVLFRRQKNESTAAAITSPSAIAPLT